uniref:ZP domain-containing protein n=1 Tax=Stomoxys calcitrans TaxID=35570 RepID=A0A1I8NMP2_STOCA
MRVHSPKHIENNHEKYTAKSPSTLWLRLASSQLSACLLLLVFMGIACLQIVHANAADHNSESVLGKGLQTRMRSPKIAHIHVLQAVAESLPQNENSVSELRQDKPIKPAGKFEIRSVSGEPNYKSVNLTWEVEFVPSSQDIITNSSQEIEPPAAFQLFFCELQSFGPHRCRSKIVNGTMSPYDNNDDNDLEVINKIRQVRQFATQVENLRMATKYSFHVRSLPKNKPLKKVTGRSEVFENEVEGNDFLSNNYLGGQTIVIPTKGFSAQATRCLPNASEIEVETGPNFGGKIVVDGGNCGIKGDPSDDKDKYVMRIDHKACGSMVKPETNTVETFITVQENLGIFTHSTRRFVVVCSYQSGMQTVRASFSVPGRGGAAAVSQHESIEEEERMGRGLKPFRFVDKSELILKENDSEENISATQSSEEVEALVQEMDNPIVSSNQTAEQHEHDNDHDHNTEHEDEDTTNAVAILENIIPGVNEDHIKAESLYTSRHLKANNDRQQDRQLDEETIEEDGEDEPAKGDNEQFSARYAKLILERNDRDHDGYDEADGNEGEDDRLNDTPTGRAFGTILELVSANMGSVLLTILISVILIGVCIYILYRETSKPPHMPPITPPSSTILPRHQHLKENHTLPRTLRNKQQDLLA